MTGALVALGAIGFAIVNIVFEMTGHLADGPYAAYADAFTVMNWLVVGLKVFGAAVALLSLAEPPGFVPPAVLTVFVWGAFATLGVYALGNVVQVVGMASGVAGSIDQIDMAGIAYVLFFLVFAAGFGVLAVSYSRRYGLRKGSVVLGVLCAPVVLGSLFAAIPTVLAGFGLLPTS